MNGHTKGRDCTVCGENLENLGERVEGKCVGCREQ